MDDPATPGDPLRATRDGFADLGLRSRFRLKPGSYAHGVAWCRPGDTYLGEPAHRGDCLVIYAPNATDVPHLAELPAAWFEEVPQPGG